MQFSPRSSWWKTFEGLSGWTPGSVLMEKTCRSGWQKRWGRRELPVTRPESPGTATGPV
jgi:hypothetical protein